MAHSRKQPNAVVDDQETRNLREIQLHCDEYKPSVFTAMDLRQVIKISDFFKSSATTALRWCSLCTEQHPPSLICFSDTHMAAEDQDILQETLNSWLHFEWTIDGYHKQVFKACRYFLISEDHILLQFMNSMSPN